VTDDDARDPLPRRRAAFWLRAIGISGAALAAVLAENARPLRARRESRGRRTARNLITAALTAAAVSLIQSSILERATDAVESRRVGLLQRLPLPRAARVVAGVLLLDYTLWWWHWLNHRVPLFWRFHLVHHVDRDLDASTALRFHFGEMSLSVVYRAMQVRLFGIDRETLALWQAMLFASIFFHHSNTDLPPETERLLSRVIVTPRMHGIHHSDYADETHSNWASLFSWWDMFHGTMRTDIPQEEIVIGVPAYDDAAAVTLGKITALPFLPQTDDWTDRDGIRHVTR
jgi:sterol desaturase/sphingolipid hydroxylase (fatty acid hydroxylase superfamily)